MEVILNEVFDLGVMPLFLVEHQVVLLNKDSPKKNALKKVPNFHFVDKILRNHVPPPGPQKACFQ